MSRLRLPVRPRPIVSQDGRWEVRLLREVYDVVLIEPRSKEELDLSEAYGKVVRVLYSNGTLYDNAVAKAKELINEGHLPERIQLVFAGREVMEALCVHGAFTVVDRHATLTEEAEDERTEDRQGG